MELDVRHAVVLGPGEGEVITERAARTLQIKAGIEAIAVTETRYEPGERGPEAHVHHRHTDAFYVLEGTMLYELGPDSETVGAPAGSFIAAPPNVAHSFRNEGPGRARFLNFHAPSEGFHDYLRASYAGDDTSWFDQYDQPDGGRPFADALVCGPGAGETIEVAGSPLVLKAIGEGTDGMLFLAETTIPAGFPGPRPHVHHVLHDLFYVLDGTLTLRRDDEVIEATPGTFACFPPGVVHTFSNPGEAPVRFLTFTAPAGWESYIRDLAAAFGGDRPPTPEEIDGIASRHDYHPVSQDPVS
jgi:mannose-6-phosphate isomerase-like protein (cupin superfamily)